MSVYAHTLTWPELVGVYGKGGSVITSTGYLLCSPDRKLDPDKGYGDYLIELGKAVKAGKDIPMHVQLAFQLHRERANALCIEGSKTPIPLPTNPQGKKLSWSFSALNDAETCMAQYAARRFYETVKFTQNEANIWGDRVHKAMESRLKKGTKLPKEMAQWEKYCQVILAQANVDGGYISVEDKVTLTKDFTRTDWFASDAWYRGALDVLVIVGDVAYVFDWKTGKVKDQPEQLELFAATVFLLHPQVNKVVSRYIWLQYDQVTGAEYLREQALGLWQKNILKVVRVEQAWDNEVFACRPSGLCRGWCPHTTCTHWKPKKG